MFAIKFSREKEIKFLWIAGFYLPKKNATVFSAQNEEESKSNIENDQV